MNRLKSQGLSPYLAENYHEGFVRKKRFLVEIFKLCHVMHGTVVSEQPEKKSKLPIADIHSLLKSVETGTF